MDFQFEWDPHKDAANIKKHRVSFWEASTVFGDPLARYARDTEHSNSEERMQIVGMSRQSRILVVTFVERVENIRIITARRSTKNERKHYEEFEA